MMSAHWTANPPREIHSREELIGTIEVVRAVKEPTMLFLERSDGYSLILGLGSAQSVLTLVEPNGTTLHSLGDAQRSGTLRFWCRDQVDEFLAEMAVPESVAVDAALAFFSSTEMPPNIRWERDWQ